MSAPPRGPPVIGGSAATEAVVVAALARMPHDVQRWLSGAVHVAVVPDGHDGLAISPVPERWLLIFNEGGLLGPDGEALVAHECAHAVHGTGLGPDAAEAAAARLTKAWGFRWSTDAGGSDGE